MSTLSARLTQGVRLCVLALAVFARPRARGDRRGAQARRPAPEEAMPILPVWPGLEQLRGAAGIRRGAIQWSEDIAPAAGCACANHALRICALPRGADRRLVSADFTRLTAPIPAPTIDLTIHFRAHRR
jgi:hypothetical protein